MRGIGVDIVDLVEFAPRVARAEAAFVKQHFTEREIAYAFSAVSGNPAQHLAARYAAKEASLKALDQARGELFAPMGAVDYRLVEVTLDGTGRPRLLLHGPIAAFAKKIGIGDVRASLSHDGRSAIAMVFMT